MRNKLATLLYAILAGFCIGLGGTIFIVLKDTFPGSHVVGALLFSVGLFVICTRGYNLYTGKVCYLPELPFPGYLLDLFLIWIGNFLGCMLLSWLQSLTSLFGPGGINMKAAEMVAKKLESSYSSFFVLGILCGIFISIAVRGFASNPHELGKYLSIFFGVSIFILSGTEHCVADMYYFSVSGLLYENPGQSLLSILAVSLGNTAGCAVFPFAEKLKLYLTPSMEKN